jgi:hypothetical protein
VSLRLRTVLLAAVACAVGLAIAYVDSRPTWDDTGVTAGALFAAGAAFGYLGRSRAWLWALLIGVWIPVLEFRGPAGGAALLALVFAFAGAACGSLIGRARPLDQGVGNRR